MTVLEAQEQIYNLVCKHFPNDDNFKAFYKEFAEIRKEKTIFWKNAGTRIRFKTKKYVCDKPGHGTSGQSPSGKCPICIYEDMKESS